MLPLVYNQTGYNFSLTHAAHRTHFNMLPNDDHKTGKSFNCDLKAVYTTIIYAATAAVTVCHKCTKKEHKSEGGGRRGQKMVRLSYGMK